jgi:NAD(P)-dependent dehydrogenase (short-subunit alcohol dehydrogenase family)
MNFDACGSPPRPASGLLEPITSGLALITGGTGAVCSEVGAGLAVAGLDVAFACRPSRLTECSEFTRALWRARNVPTHRTAYFEAVDVANASSVVHFINSFQNILVHSCECSSTVLLPCLR